MKRMNATEEREWDEVLSVLGKTAGAAATGGRFPDGAHQWDRESNSSVP